MAETVTVQFASSDEIEVATVALTEYRLLKKESDHGEIVLVIQPRGVIESHRKVSKRYPLK